MNYQNRYPAIIFVCTANRCRSPLAEALLQRAFNRLGSSWEKWRVESAGTWAIPGLPPMPGTLFAAKEMGLNLEAHRSRPVSGDLLEEFDLILVMEPNHKEALQTEFPDLARRIFLLSEMTSKDLTVFDPVGEADSEYLNTGLEIEQFIQEGLRQIITLATRPL
jgi:protein-tyrosine-phosphatase